MFHYQVNRCNQIGFQLLLFLTLTLVTWQALSPQPIDQTEQINDKLGHALVFLFLAAIADHAYASTKFNIKKFSYLILYGIGIECAQYFVPSRQFSFLDMAADAAGIIIYWVIFSYIVIRDPTSP